MAMLEEEENFIRIFKLVSGVAPTAVRTKFDQYFPPVSLTAILKQAEPKLKALHTKKQLTAAQMALLFPTSGITSSSSYDVTLMIFLLRNLTSIPPPVNGFDVIPPSTEISDGADLARVKYYRNKIAHSEVDRLQTTEFTAVWNDLEQSLVRLGGSNIKALCNDIKQAILNQDILLEVHKEISQFRKELEQINLYVVALDNEIKALWETAAEMEQFTSTSRDLKRKLEECSCHDSHEQVIQEWEQADEIFVMTHVVDVILEKLQTNPCITVTGQPGMGKSAIIHHIALLLHRRQGYTIVPCTNPQEIVQHFKKAHLQVFVFDDVCGRYSVNHFDVGEWIKMEPNIIRILNNTKTKIISSCRLQIFTEKQYQNINLLKECINLTSDENSLTACEKMQIALKYLDKDIVDRYNDILEKCEFLPLMCYLCKQTSPTNIQDFLSNPFDIYTKELNSMKTQLDNTKWCVLFLVILHNGCIEESFFGHEHDYKRDELQTILDNCSVNKSISIMHVREQLESLVGTYMKSTETDTPVKKAKRSKVNEKISFAIIHDKMFDFLCHYYGSNQQQIFIKHAKASVLGERTQIESLNEDHDQFKIIITMENEDEFFQRSLEFWKNKDYISVLNYDQMKFKKFREKLISNIKMLDPVHLGMSGHDLQSALHIVCKAGYYDMFCFLFSFKNKSDINHNDLLQSACYGGNIDIVKDLINMGANVNCFINYKWFSSSPFIEACTRGHLPIVTLLIDKGADVNLTAHVYSPLISACEGGHLPIVTLLIDKGADVNVRTEEYTPLISACEGGHLPIVTLLIDKGADVNLAAHVYSPLISACKGGHLQIVTLLIDKGADVNLTAHVYSPLISACEGGHLPIVTLLIDKGADVNLTEHVYSPLISACKGGHLQIVTLLIDKGADVNLTAHVYSPLISACEGGHLPIVTLLIDKGADFNVRTEEYTPLISACKGGHLPIVTVLIDKGADVNLTAHVYSPLISACEGGHLPIVTLLIDKGADVNVRTEEYTPLMSACEGGHLPIVTVLIDKGADVNLTAHVYSPLISACEGGHLPIVTLLIDKGADVNVRTEKYTPLISACEGGHLPIVTLLIDKGADVNVRTKKYTPLISACIGGHLQIVTLLIDNGADVNLTAHVYSPLISACIGGHLQIVTLLIDKGADVNLTTDLFSPLISACIGGHLPIVTLLIDKGADVNLTTVYSPLISACKGGHLQLVTLLIDKRADVNLTTDLFSPLISACIGGHLPIVTLLIDKGADVNKTARDNSPLISACKSGHLPIVNLLIDKGADVNVTTDWYSPLISACEGGHLPIVTLLIDKGADVNLTTDVYSPLISANEGGHLSIVNLLIDKGAVQRKMSFMSLF